MRRNGYRKVAVVLAVFLVIFLYWHNRSPIIPHIVAPLSMQLLAKRVFYDWRLSDGKMRLFSQETPDKVDEALLEIDMMKDGDDTAQQVEFFKRHSHQGISLVIQVNDGFRHLAMNLLCSLHRLNPEFVKAVVFVAMDGSFARNLQTHLMHSLIYAQSNASTTPFSGFGIYSFSAANFESSYLRGGSKQYYFMVRFQLCF